MNLLEVIECYMHIMTDQNREAANKWLVDTGVHFEVRRAIQRDDIIAGNIAPSYSLLDTFASLGKT